MFLHVISLLRKAQKAEGGKGDNQRIGQIHYEGFKLGRFD